MRNIPSALLAQFEVGLQDRAVPNNAHASYKKWLRFYLDFCEKYHFPDSKRECLTHFLHKLEDKRQTKAQQLEASQAISLYYKLIDSMAPHDELGSPQKVISPGKPPDESPDSSGASQNRFADPEKIAPPETNPRGTASPAPTTRSNP